MSAARVEQGFRHLADIFLFAVLCCWLLFACPAQAADRENHFVAAVLADFPPLYVTSGGYPDGFALDVLKVVSEQAGLTYELFVTRNWAEAMDAVSSGKADVIPGIGISAARKKDFIFTSVMETVPVSCFVRADSTNINGIGDLAGHRTAVIDRSAAQTTLGLRSEIILTPHNSIDEALFSLLAGTSDAFVFPEPVLWQKAAEIGVEDKIKVVGKPLMELKRGYLLRKKDTELRDRLNTALKSFVGSPEFNEIYLKWRVPSEKGWPVRTLVTATLVLLVIIVLGFGLWRWRSVSKLNWQLQKVLEAWGLVQCQLKDSEAQLNRAQELTSFGSFERNLSTDFGRWSLGLYKLLGFPQADEAPSSEEFLACFHPDDLKEYQRKTHLVTPENPSFFIEFRYRQPGRDSYRTASGIFSYEFTDDGIPIKHVGTIQDITRQKRIKAQLIKAKEKAEAASTSKSEFLANMSHELRTPLNGVMGMLQLMALDELAPVHKEYVDSALVSCRNLARLISDILDLSKVEAGKLELHPAPFLLDDLLMSVSEAFSRQIKDKGVEFACTMGDDIPACVTGDEVRLRQVLFNLVGNAVKFTQRGSISVHVSREASSAGECVLLFSVSDTGIGIPKNMQAKVFGPFVQVGGTARKFQGTGLGLHIVKQLVILMGGEVHMESEEGKGTTVSFSALLPCEEKDADQCHAPESELVTEIGPKKILIVEDERVNQIAISKLVERLGHSTTSVANGQEALNALVQKNFDLILMDIQMPVMNGIETTQQIRALKDEKHRAIPIVALTAHAMSGDREKFLEVGMNDYLAKPISMDTLAVVLARVLGA